MTVHAPDMSAELHCHVCGYDLRAQPGEGKCPECGAAVAEARRVAAAPRRPAWRDSDRRWRRRMVVGAWVLVFVPLMQVLTTFGWAERVRVPNFFSWQGGVHYLSDTLVMWVYEPLVFCVGVVLLFAKERGRGRGRLDWTRRWGVICTYVVLLISTAEFLLMSALVMAAIAMIFAGIPAADRPYVPPLFVEMRSALLRYGTTPYDVAGDVRVALSSILVLLACLALFDALRSSGWKWAARVLLAPLAFLALVHLSQVAWLAWCGPGPQWWRAIAVGNYGLYFCSHLLVDSQGWPFDGRRLWGSELNAFLVEAAKWGSMLVIAVWLSAAQVAAWVRGRKVRAAAKAAGTASATR